MGIAMNFSSLFRIAVLASCIITLHGPAKVRPRWGNPVRSQLPSLALPKGVERIVHSTLSPTHGQEWTHGARPKMVSNETSTGSFSILQLWSKYSVRTVSP
jgi:hypothetical protein